MNSIEKIVQDIQFLIQCGDLSDTPQLRELHANYMAALDALKKNLVQCRELVSNGSVQEAKQLNCSFEPSLTRQAELLDFPQRDEFFTICREYGLELPVQPEEALLNVLSAPVSSGEKHLHALLQDYRKIARSGSMEERIALLRRIVAKLPASARWRNDLLSAERGRLQEITRIVEKLPEAESSQNELEKIYRELLSPEWIAPVKPELLQLLRDRLAPLQQLSLKREAEERLRQLQDQCIEQDIPGLRKAFDQWLAFSSNPTLQLTFEQKQAAADIENFLIAREEKLQDEQEIRTLVEEAEEKLSAGCTYADVAGIHNRLQLLAADHPVPPALLGQLKTLLAETQHHERLRNIRRTIFGVCAVLLAVAALLWIVQYRQHRAAVRHLCSNMEKLISEKKYDDVQDLFRETEKNSPDLARAVEVRTLYHTAVQEQEEAETLQKQRQADFAGLLKQLRRLAKADDAWDNSKAIDRTIEACKSLLDKQPQSARDEFRTLETAIVEKRTARKQAREKGFLTFCSDADAKMQKAITSMAKQDLNDLTLFHDRLLQDFEEKARTTPGLAPELKNREKLKLEKLRTRLAAAIKQETLRRQVVAPTDFITYASGLETCRYQDAELAAEFHHAITSLEMWRNIFDSYQHGFVPASSDQLSAAEIDKCRGILKKDLARLMPAATRSPEFSRFFSDLQTLGALKELCFVSTEGTEYFFYSDKEIIWEKLVNPKRINLSFFSIENGGFFTFSYDYSKRPDPLRLLNAPKKLNYKLPSRVALANSRTPLTRDQADRVWAGYQLTDRFSALSTDGPGVYNNLLGALTWLLENGNVPNFYLKELLIVRFLDEFCRVQPLCSEAVSTAEKLRNFYSSRNRNWRAPQEFAEYAADKKELQRLWNGLDLERFAAAAKLRMDFVCAFHARRLMPIGIVQHVSGNRVRIHTFRQEQPAEVLAVTGDKTILFSDGIWKNAPSAEDRKYLHTGLLLWGFEDNRSTREFVNEWNRKATKMNVRLNVKPFICPEGIAI